MQHDRGDQVVSVGEDVSLGGNDVAGDAFRREGAGIDFR